MNEGSKDNNKREFLINYYNNNEKDEKQYFSRG